MSIEDYWAVKMFVLYRVCYILPQRVYMFLFWAFSYSWLEDKSDPYKQIVYRDRDQKDVNKLFMSGRGLSVMGHLRISWKKQDGCRWMRSY